MPSMWLIIARIIEPHRRHRKHRFAGLIIQLLFSTVLLSEVDIEKKYEHLTSQRNITLLNLIPDHFNIPMCKFFKHIDEVNTGSAFM